MSRQRFALPEALMDERYDGLLSRFSAGNEPPLIIIVGLRQGNLLEAIERRGLSTKVLAIEPLRQHADEIVTRGECASWCQTGRLTLLVGPDFVGAGDAWKLLGRADITPPMIVSPTLEREHPDAAANAKGLAKQIVLGAKANDEARRQFAGRYLLNTLKNIPIVASEGDVASLAGAFRDVPAIVIGAGPSLDRNLAAIRDVVDRVLLVAVDTAVRPLLAAGVRPNLVVSVDPSSENARHLMDLPDASGTYLVAEASVDPRIFPQFAGRTFTFKVSRHHPWPWLGDRRADRGSLRAWGSVLTTAFDLALACGCDPIVFAGADLAYTDGSPYCRNTVYEPEWAQFDTVEARADHFREFLAKGSIQAPDIHGRQALTAPRFVQFRDWIVQQAGAVGQVVNVTGAGILHGGPIAQADLESLGLRPLAGGSAGLQSRLGTAWSATIDARLGSKAGLEFALNEPGALPLGTQTISTRRGREVQGRFGLRRTKSLYCSRISRGISSISDCSSSILHATPRSTSNPTKRG